MQIVTTKKDLQTAVQACKAEGKTIGLVPTMGALHEGHASLVRRAVEDNDICVVSVFVNPTQFNNKEDLAKYPRNIERDAELLSSIGAHYVFAPTPEEMYSAEEMNSTFEFDFAGLDKVMEGKMRPGHFNGVVQVVSRLFYLVQPDKAYFGEKDFQQLAIIHHMVEAAFCRGKTDRLGDLKNAFFFVGMGKRSRCYRRRYSAACHRRCQCRAGTRSGVLRDSGSEHLAAYGHFPSCYRLHHRLLRSRPPD